LGKSISIDFTKGAVDSFTASGNPTYDSNGVSFTVAKSGDSPTLISRFYIMFGKVSITMKVAPGAGIVSTLVLQSDDLDEIDMEWLGADDSEVQTNYFGKGNTATYTRGAFNPAPNNQGEFVTYSIEYTADQVVWSVGGSTVRVLKFADAEVNQYPQTPMQVKFGAWSGGDPSNAAGTIGWARGPTDYSKGPFTMVVQSINIDDYSSGTSYSYTGTTGNWQDISAEGGSVGSNTGGSSPVVVAPSSSATSASPSIPVGGFGNGDASSTITKTGYPWVASTTLQTVAATTEQVGIPSGWTVSSSGKVVPAKTSAASSELSPLYFLSY
jgi:beta-glucanase (GH16 family)